MFTEQEYLQYQKNLQVWLISDKGRGKALPATKVLDLAVSAATFSVKGECVQTQPYCKFNVI